MRLRGGAPWVPAGPRRPGAASQLTGTLPTPGDGQVDFEEFVTLLGPKLSTSGIPEKFHGTDFDTVFWKVCPG